MIVNAARRRFARRAMLFYSNRRPEDCAFLPELRQIGSGNKNYQTICAMTKMAKSRRPWHGETGYINRVMLVDSSRMWRHLSITSPGPRAMVAAMKETLTGVGVHEDDIRSEDSLAIENAHQGSSKST